MKRIRWMVVICLACVLGAPGCGDDDDDNDGAASDGDTDTDTDTDTEGAPLPFEALDMLFVVDNSASMEEEQAIFATSVLGLVNSLVEPLPTCPFAAADDVRVAVVSSDMGMQWGGNPYEVGDGWPNDQIPCSAAGDDGEFQSYAFGKTIDLQSGKIPCGQDAAQCPTDWTCEEIGDDGVGVCTAPGADGSDQVCPELAARWTETPGEDGPNPEMAFQVACLSSLGTSGCGFEQQLQAASRGLTREDQQVFVREDALLAVLLVSDEEDCSVEDKDLFMAPEIQDLSAGKVNIACGENEQFLYSPTWFYQSFVDRKGGHASAVVFGAIVGVPVDEACQGTGSELSAAQCLQHEKMQLNPIQEESSGMDITVYAPACSRTEDGQEVTKARPARRIVELAQEFEGGGYVYSICNQDWTPAMREFAGIVLGRME